MSRHEWSRKIAANARAALINGVVSAVVGLVTVPLTLRALGTEGFGTFQVLVSLANLALVADVGLGLALLTRVGQLAGAGQHQQIRQSVGGALVVISMVVVLVSSAAAIVLQIWNVPAFLNVPVRLQAEAQSGCYIVLTAFALRMPLSVFSSAHAGMQLGHRLIKWTSGGNVLASVGMVVVATTTRRLDLALGAQTVLGLGGTIGALRLGFRLEPSTLPLVSWRYASIGWRLLRSGFVYYILQLEVLIIGSIDNLVIAKVLGPQAVAVYSITQRLISLAFSLVYSLGSSFWGGVAHAIGVGNLEWIREEAAQLRRLGSLWMAVIAGGFAAVGGPVIFVWTGGRLQVDPWLPVVLGAYFGFLGHTMIDASILNGAEKIRQQVITVGLDALLNLGLSVWLARKIGYTGVGLGTLAAYLTCTFLPLQIFSWRFVLKGARPPFWTSSLTTLVLAIAAGVGINRLLVGWVGMGPLVTALVGGTASLLLTLVLVRLLVGREGIEALKRSAVRGSRPASGAEGQSS